MLSPTARILITSVGISFSLSIWLVADYFSLARANRASQGYVPPAKDSKQQKATASGSRGCLSEAVDIAPLIPTDRNATTISSNPSFSFLVKSQPNFPATFSLVEPGVVKPVWEEELNIEQTGIFSVSLPQKVNLEVGKEYVWNLKVICNPNRPSENWYIRAVIQRVPVTAELTRELEQADTEAKKAAILVREGIWYDAIAIGYHSQHKLKDTSYFKQLLARIGLSLPKLD